MARVSSQKVQERRAKRAARTIDERVAEILEMDCPVCGRQSLTIDDPSLRTAPVIYCERALCRWKPSILTK